MVRSGIYGDELGIYGDELGIYGGELGIQGLGIQGLALHGLGIPWDSGPGAQSREIILPMIQDHDHQEGGDQEGRL